VYRFPWAIMGAFNVQHQTGRLWSRTLQVAGLGFPSLPTINMDPNNGDRRGSLLQLKVLSAPTYTVPGPAANSGMLTLATNLTISRQIEPLVHKHRPSTPPFHLLSRLRDRRQVKSVAMFVLYSQ